MAKTLVGMERLRFKGLRTTAPLMHALSCDTCLGRVLVLDLA